MTMKRTQKTEDYDAFLRRLLCCCFVRRRRAEEADGLFVVFYSPSAVIKLWLELLVNDGEKWVSWAFEYIFLLFQLFSPRQHYILIVLAGGLAGLVVNNTIRSLLLLSLHKVHRRHTA